jgi:hypothetical protein
MLGEECAEEQEQKQGTSKKVTKAVQERDSKCFIKSLIVKMRCEWIWKQSTNLISRLY